MANRSNFDNELYYRKAGFAGFGQKTIAVGVTSDPDDIFYCVYATEDSTIDYDSALDNNEGDDSFSAVPIAAKSTYYGIMKNVKTVSGNVIGYIIGDSINDGRKRYSIPSGFDHNFTGIKIYRRLEGLVYSTGVTTATYRKTLVSPTVKYLDVANGSDSNDGSTLALAYKTIGKLQAASFDRAFISEGNYGAASNTIFNADREFIGSGKVRFYYGFSGTDKTWTDIDDGVFTTPSTVDTKTLADSSNLDSNGVPTKLVSVADAGEVTATKNSYFRDSGTDVLYVHTFDDREPDGDIIASLDSIAITAAKVNYAENIDFVSGVTVTNSTATKNDFTAKDCNFILSADSNGVTVKGNVVFVLDNCSSYDNNLGGYHYEKSSTYEVDAIENYSKAYRNGIGNTTGLNVGSSAKDDSRVLRIGGLYYNNEGPGINDMTTAKSLNIECSAYASLSTVADAKSGFVCAADGDSGETSVMWLDSCRNNGNDDTIGAENRGPNSILYIRNSELKDVKAGTVLTEY